MVALPHRAVSKLGMVKGQLPLTKKDLQDDMAERIAKSAARLESLARAVDLQHIAYFAGMLRIEAQDEADGRSDVIREKGDFSTNPDWVDVTGAETSREAK